MMNKRNWLLSIAVALSFGACTTQYKGIITENSLEEAPPNWFNLDPAENEVAGTSVERAYASLLADKNSEEIIVAVIDSGVDTEHEDLEGKIWVNEDEIPDNGIDDDKNGYIDDVHGWNFLGGPNGEMINYETLELTRLYRQMKAKFEGNGGAQSANPVEYQQYQEIKAAYEKEVGELKEQSAGFRNFYAQYQPARDLLKEYLDKEEITLEDVQTLETDDERVNQARAVVQFAFLNELTDEQIEGYNDYLTRQLDYNYNLAFDPRSVVGDDPANLDERYYGNNMVEGPDAEHGTHVAGIIAANRKNSLGVQGIADGARIMVLRAVPNGDERDKDIANAIYYAVDNGAKVINMSFGKAYSPNKEKVDAAARYAAEKGVLLVHAAGNEAKDIDVEKNFPTKIFLSGETAGNWLEVGASGWGGKTKFVADFSNYGQKKVDLFAPGVDLYSTVPDDEYRSLSGTSMAAPVVSGIAALVWSYYPELTIDEVKEILLKTTVNYGRYRVNKPTEGEEEGEIKFKKLSETGGVVNAYNALLLAEKMSK